MNNHAKKAVGEKFPKRFSVTSTNPMNQTTKWFHLPITNFEMNVMHNVN